ncbi:MAG: hypothetical protein AB8G05_19835 [Oligoflexales bacterium]
MLTVLLITGCGQSVLSSFVGEISSTETEAAQDTSAVKTDLEEESVPPAMVTGASLTCDIATTNTKDSFVEISCYLEKEGSILKDVGLSASDLTIQNDNGQSLILDFSPQKDGTFLIKVASNELSDINISLKSIEGNKVKESDSEYLSTVILYEELAPTPEASPSPEQASDGGESVILDPMVEINSDNQTSEDQVAKSSSNTSESNVCNYLGEPGSWIMVPGNPVYGTNDFCVIELSNN